MTLPPLPPWEGAHVLIVHFPVALLLIAPILMFLAMLVPTKWPGMAAAAWTLLFLGTVAAWIAVRSGEAAYDNTVEMPDAVRQIMNQHAQLGHAARTQFTILCAAYGAILLIPLLFKRLKLAPIRILGTLIILAAYAWAGLQLANAAHLGGHLVHEYGVHAAFATSPTTSTQPSAK